MPQKRRGPQPNKRQQAARSSSPSTDSRRMLASLPPIESAAPVTYGKAFIVAEDSAKNTFYFQGGAWVPYPDSIAECRRTCLVTQLPQKLKNMTRYEIRCPE